jgi:hypothetical protein
MNFYGYLNRYFKIKKEKNKPKLISPLGPCKGRSPLLPVSKPPPFLGPLSPCLRFSLPSLLFSPSRAQPGARPRLRASRRPAATRAIVTSAPRAPPLKPAGPDGARMSTAPLHRSPRQAPSTARQEQPEADPTLVRSSRV